ncbi:hypothetical protein CPAR01_05071 [Colletotrichum paranaense]|uniref:Uncharacterized protein n=1 Tax=Colletotrichum paranaense TaxID=1914294 RepID=A0ABQ9SQ76_9PEZI|nr:uncharacterized protein CPAR01_05071 [Colletotrichum paranaense]KAK1541684.1 hypothetical protein CPAR01_05071 [Colletotrichum paranaense]
MGFSKLFDFFQTSTCIASPLPPTALEGLLLSSPAGLIPSLTPTGKPKACSGSIFASPATISNACGKKACLKLVGKLSYGARSQSPVKQLSNLIVAFTSRYLSGANPDSPSHRPNPVPEQQDPYPSTATIWVQSIVATLVQLSRLVTAGSSSPGQVATCILYTTCTYICDYLAEIQSSSGSSQYAWKGFTRKSGPPEVEMSKNKAENIHGARRPRMRACQTAV